MNKIKILICLLLSISITGITSFEVSYANRASDKGGKTSLNTQEKTNQELKSKIDNLTKDVAELKNKPESKIKIIENKNPIDANSYWITPLLLILILATVGKLIHLILEIEEIKKHNNSIKRNLDKKLDRPDRDPFSTKSELNKLIEKQQKLEFDISNFQREISTFQKETKNSLSILTATIRDSSSRIQNPVPISNNQQSNDLLMNYYPSENIEPVYLTDYNNRQKSFADTYRSLVIDRDPDNYNLSRAGQTEEVILTEESRGNYWLFSYDGLIYVVPSQKLKIREDKLNEVKDLFDCENYQGFNYDNYTLIKPALVSKKVNGNWQLKEKGNIQFG